MIAISGWLAWSARGWTPALGVYAAQLVLNAAWTPLFFGAERYGLAVAEIAVLWLAIVVNIVMFRRISRPAAWLLVPYLLWVTYAASLTSPSGGSTEPSGSRPAGEDRDPDPAACPQPGRDRADMGLHGAPAAPRRRGTGRLPEVTSPARTAAPPKQRAP